MGGLSFKLPDIGEGIAEAEIVAWHVKVGDRVSEDQPLADMMTDKATVEIESPVVGVVKRLAGEVGDMVPIGSVLVEFEHEGGAVAEDSAPTPQPIVAAPKPESEPEQAPPPPPLPPPTANVEPAPPEPVAKAREGRRVLASPAVRARAKDLGIDLAQIKSDGEHIRHADIDAFLRYGSTQGYHAPHASRAWADETVRVIGMRRRIAENMAASKRHIPHFSYVERYDVTALEEVRGQLNAARGERPRLTILPFVITAICRLIPKYPMLNAHFDDERGEVTRYGAVHVGMAAQTPAGLMVPVVRDAQDRNLWQLAAEINRLARAARDGSAKIAELSGSTLTVTSLGPMGGMVTTPVINRPEVAIIGPNNIVEEPMFVRDALGFERLEKRKLMNISMSCDHRVVDGWDAASFAQDLKKLIEAPALILAEGLQ